jgi:uncharacterized protein YidB (DUF937 family)
MGILDGLLGSLLGGATGSAQQGQSQLMQVALQLIQQNGGLPGIISKFQNGGMAQQIESWVGHGENLPITGSQLQELLGTGTIGQMAQQMGLSHSDASSNLAQMLPQLIDKLTPNGRLPDNHSDLLAQAMSMLNKRTA